MTITLLLSCKKERISRVANRVDIYLLKSFTSTIDQSTIPVTFPVTNAVLEDIPLVADQDIILYTRSSTTFKLRKDIQTVIRNYGPDKAFAVTVDNQPIYYGKFRPGYLSSIAFGVATIAPGSFNNDELKIDFAPEENSSLQKLDQRNDSRIIKALKATGRLQ